MSTRLTTATLTGALLLAACSGGDDAEPDPTATVTEEASAEEATPEATPTSETESSIDVDSQGDPTDDAQDASGIASLGTAVATIDVRLPGEWQYEGTYGDGSLPYAVLVDAAQPFDLSEPGSDAYRDSVWVQVETYAVEGESPYGTVPESEGDLVTLLEEATGGEAQVVDGRDVPVVYVRYEQDGAQVEDLLARHDGIWVLARPSNVDVKGYLDGDTDGILSAVLDGATIK